VILAQEIGIKGWQAVASRLWLALGHRDHRLREETGGTGESTNSLGGSWQQGWLLIACFIPCFPVII
jgi:hypothetical protein